jgi:hypothetical protein
MWDRLLFAVRRAAPDLGQWLGSTRLSVVLMVVTAQYYLFLAIWSGSSPPHVVQNIAGLIPFWLLYALLLTNTGVCLWRRIPVLKRDVAASPRLTERPADWELETPPETSVKQAEGLLRRMKFRPATVDANRVWGHRRRWAALGTYLFHGAFFLLAAGFLVTFLSRQEATVRIAAGEEYAGRPDQVLSISPPRILAAGIPAVDFKVEKIRPEFWGEQLLFTTLEAEIERDGGKRSLTRINRPLWVGPATFLRLSGFGYAPRYEIVDRQGKALDGAFVKLNVFPPGQRDYFVLPDYPHRIYVEVLPDVAVEQGTAVTRSLNLVNPGVELRVLRGRVDLGGRRIIKKEGFEFEGLTLRFPEIRYWGEFSIVRDPGAPVLFLGYLIALAGLLLKVRGKRVEAEWRAGQGGAPGTLRGWGGDPPEGSRLLRENEPC